MGSTACVSDIRMECIYTWNAHTHVEKIDLLDVDIMLG